MTNASENNSSVTFGSLPPGAVPAQDPRTVEGNAEGKAGGNAGGTASSLIDKEKSAAGGAEVPGVGHVDMVGEPNTQNTAVSLQHVRDSGVADGGKRTAVRSLGTELEVRTGRVQAGPTSERAG